MTDLAAYPDDLDECHRLLARIQAQCALLEQKQQAWCKQEQLYADLQKAHQQTTTDLLKLREDYDDVLHQLELLRRWAFGARRERVVDDPRQKHLFDLDSILPPGIAAPNPDELSASEPEAEQDAAEKRAAARQKKRADRKLCLDALPQVHHEHDIAEEEKICSVCGSEKRLIGEDISRMLEFVPAQLHVHNHHRRKYGCTCGKCGIAMPPLPEKPIEKCIAGPGLISSLIVSKTGDHLPIYRSEDILVRQGLHISRSTQCDWLHAAAMLLMAFTAFMSQKIRSQRIIWTDDTPVMFFDRHGRVLQSKKKKQKTGETSPEDSSMRRGRFWPYIGGDEAPYVVFDFTISRRRDGPMEMLNGWSGFLQADAYSGYDPVIHNGAGRIIEVSCWAHARRHFEQAMSSEADHCEQVISWIRRLHDIEDVASTMTHDECRTLRQAQAVPVLQRLAAWMEIDADGRPLKASPPHGLLPKSPLMKAIRYASNNWKALNVYTTDGRLTIDNNMSERTVRAIAIGRKNWLFIGSEAAGYRMAVLYSIIASARRHHLEPFAYVRDLLLQMRSLCCSHNVDVPDFRDVSGMTAAEFRALGTTLASQLPTESLTALLPDNWAKNNPQHVLVHRVEESRRAANRRRDRRESRRRLAITPAGTATTASPPDPSNTGPPKSDGAKPDATSRGP
jgi:transposase